MGSDPDPLRVAWFGHASGRRADGLSTYSRETVAALREGGAEVCFFSHRHDGDRAPAPLHVQLRALRFKTVVIPLPGARRRIIRALEDFRPGVVHVSFSFSLLDAWIVQQARRAGCAVVATVHLPYATRRSARGRVLRALYRFHGRALRACDRCFALSEEQAALLRGVGCAPDRVLVMPNGVDADRVSPGESGFRRKLGATFVVTYIGRLDPEKRVEELVRTFTALQWPAGHVLVVAGAGSRERAVRQAASGHSNVRLLGLVTDRDRCIDILRGTDVFVLPSTAEGLSLSMLEAMSAGCAVVATAAGEDAAALADGGLAIPVRPLQPALRDALIQLRDDPALRETLQARARARVVRMYSLHARVARILSVYEELRGRPAAAA